MLAERVQSSDNGVAGALQHALVSMDGSSRPLRKLTRLAECLSAREMGFELPTFVG